MYSNAIRNYSSRSGITVKTPVAKCLFWASTKIRPKRPQDVTPWFWHSLTVVLWPVWSLDSNRPPIKTRKVNICMKKGFLWSLILCAGAFAQSAALAQTGQTDEDGNQTPVTQPLTYRNVIRVTPLAGVKGDLAPIVRIVSPLADSSVAPGEAKVGLKNPNGTGFLVNLEIVTRDGVPVSLREATLAPPVFGIRHVDRLNAGLLNQDAPGLYVFFDTDLITPDGTVLPKFNNFANAFNVAGTDDTPGAGVTAWLGWHVLESVPDEVDEFTLTAALIDDSGRIGMDQIKVKVDRSKRSGQTLTPAPPVTPLTGSEGVPDAPDVTIIAPRVPTSIALGQQDNTLNANGALFFIQVSAVAQGDAEIAVSENGIREGFVNPLPVGLIFDPSRIPNPTTGAVAGPNRNFPGLEVTFSVPLRQANGNVVPAGVNLAPLFDVAGSEIDAQGRVRVTADWVVGAALLVPPGQKTVTITAKVTDTLGRTGVTTSVLTVSQAQNGQVLTPNPPSM